MPLAEWKERTRLLVGEEQIERLAQAHILVVGLGGCRNVGTRWCR